MSTMNISFPEALKTFVDDQVSTLGYRTSSEYVCELIRQDRDRQSLRGLRLEGAASPRTVTAEARYDDRLRGSVRDAGWR